jgi:hypothetical protein
MGGRRRPAGAHAPLHTVITRLMKMLTRHGVLIEEMGQTWLAEPQTDGDEARTLRPLQAAAITYRIAFGPRAGHMVLTLRGAMAREGMARELLCSDIDGFCLHAAVRIEAHERKRLDGAAVPHHHPAGAGRRAGTAQRRRPGGAQAQDTMARRHHAPGVAGACAAPRAPARGQALQRA